MSVCPLAAARVQHKLSVFTFLGVSLLFCKLEVTSATLLAVQPREAQKKKKKVGKSFEVEGAVSKG